MERILRKCLDHRLAINLEKSEFHTNETTFLGHIINGTDIEILIILDARERYSRYAKDFSEEQAARLPDHTQWDHRTPLKDNAKAPASRAIYKTTWEEKEALQKYLNEHLPTAKVRRSRSAASAPILFTRKSKLCREASILGHESEGVVTAGLRAWSKRVREAMAAAYSPKECKS